ncbi:MAG: MBL fold metallo-hydrolase [Gammaproteobacteria bacterium]|nr:MBL fold metallo-hydrolase [Gammaproteobacteria bacterium]
MVVGAPQRPGESTATGQPGVDAFFDEDTFTVSYVVSDPATGIAAIVDSVLDYDPASGRTSTGSADRLLAHVRDKGLDVELILETHVHADHLTAAPYLREHTGARVAIGANITTVQQTFAGIFNTGAEFETDGRQFDLLLRDGDSFDVGDIQATALHTPGHTPNCMTYLIGDAAFVGDTLFMPDFGTARCDFPGGDARTLHRSIQRIFSLPPETHLFMCHDYKAPGRGHYAWETTVAEERAANVHVHDGVTEEDFVEMRSTRDATLGMPRLILPSVQVNMRAGHLPPAESNGLSYLKIPLNAL